ncbi:hypothetical protein ACE1AT_14140 [Pelatocladus sp. BLCC-F211]|uniref:hypothetical protein n=1 Tax=Pelatocladus sp. BLCC-F211 TaxID=3342752 RepID=UPI0035BA79CC
MRLIWHLNIWDVWDYGALRFATTHPTGWMLDLRLRNQSLLGQRYADDACRQIRVSIATTINDRLSMRSLSELQTFFNF